MEIYLIRHGLTMWNTERRMQGSKNSDLTAVGEMQARMLGKKLASIHFDLIYASDSERAQQTTQLIFNKRPYNTNSDLREIAMGSWEGLTYQDIERLNPLEWHNFFHNPDAFTPIGGGESFEDLRKRTNHFIETVLLSEKHERIAVVSHRITLRMLLSIIQNDPTLFSTIDLDPTSLSIVTVNDGHFEIVDINNTDHTQDI